MLLSEYIKKLEGFLEFGEMRMVTHDSEYYEYYEAGEPYMVHLTGSLEDSQREDGSHVAGFFCVCV